MNKVLLGLAAYAVLVSGGAALAAPSALHETKTADVAAPPAKVWAAIQDFGTMTWHPAVKASSATAGNTPGSIRTLDLGGPKLIEELKAYDAAGMNYTYVITPDPANMKVLPVANYTSTISVKPSATGSTVTWTGDFQAAGADDAAASKAIGGVYEGGLAALKTKFGG